MHIIAVLVFYSLHAQDATRIPSIKNDLVKAASDSQRADALAALCFNYSATNPDSAMLFGEQAMEISQKIKYNQGIADSYNNMGWVYYQRADMQKAEAYFKNSLEVFKKMGAKKSTKMPLANLGTLYMDITEYAKSLECLMQVLKLEDEIKETGNNGNWLINKAATFHQVGRLYNLMKKPIDARNYFQQALDISKSEKSNVHIGENLMSIGNTYQAEGKDEIAIQFYDECLRYLENTNDTYRTGLAYENKASSHLNLKNYKTAIQQYNIAKEYYKKLKSDADMFYACMGIAGVYGELKDSLNGIEALSEAGVYATRLANKNLQQQVLSGLADFYKGYNDYKKAYVYLDSANAFKDSIFTKEKQSELNKLQAQFESENKQKEIELLKKDQQINMDSLQRQRIFQYAAYIIAALLLLIGFLLFKRYQFVQSVKRFKELEQIRNNIARDLHDDIGSTLSSINILSDVVLKQSAEASQFSGNIQKIKDRSSDIMERMNDIVWAINPAHDALDKILLRMKEFANDLCEQKDINCKFTEPAEDISTINLSLKKRSDMYLIFKEALNNAVKYSNAKNILVQVEKQQQHLVIAVKDDGKGFDTNTIYNGNGLKNMKSRATETGSIYKTVSEKGIGTTVSLDIPLT